MCWISYKPPVKKIAKKDILVYKFVNYNYYNPLINKCTSFFRNFSYKFGVKYNTDIKIEFDNSVCAMWVGREGFHSYCNKKTALYNSKVYVLSPFTTVVKCIIPKGSEYYVNNQYEIISNSIIILKKKSFFQKILNYFKKKVKWLMNTQDLEKQKEENIQKPKQNLLHVMVEIVDYIKNY